MPESHAKHPSHKIALVVVGLFLALGVTTVFLNNADAQSRGSIGGPGGGGGGGGGFPGCFDEQTGLPAECPPGHEPCNPFTGENCPANICFDQQSGEVVECPSNPPCQDAAGNPIDCPDPNIPQFEPGDEDEPECADPLGNPIDCPDPNIPQFEPGDEDEPECADPLGNPIDCPDPNIPQFEPGDEDEPECLDGAGNPLEDCSPENDPCAPGGAGGRDCPPPTAECTNFLGDRIPCPGEPCDSIDPTTGQCLPTAECTNFLGNRVPCPNTLDFCDPAVENCDTTECDPATEDCGNTEEPECVGDTCDSLRLQTEEPPRGGPPQTTVTINTTPPLRPAAPNPGNSTDSSLTLPPTLVQTGPVNVLIFSSFALGYLVNQRIERKKTKK